MHVLVAGGSGLIGTAVMAECHQRGWEARVLSRATMVAESGWSWEPHGPGVPPEALLWADAVVNLAGSSISQIPWTAKRKRSIMDSRVASTDMLVDAFHASARPPRVLVSGSAVGFYGDRPGEELTEASAAGTGFLRDVTVAWEGSAAAAGDVTRVALARTGLVLSARGGVLPLIVGSTRWFVGTRFGTGAQVWPWISVRDEARALVHIIETEACIGAVNLVAPVTNTSDDITKAVAHRLHRPRLFPAPAWMISAALGSAGRELLLADQNVLPAVLVSSGFEFVDQSLEALLASV